jgi:hypothetical protein
MWISSKPKTMMKRPSGDSRVYSLCRSFQNQDPVVRKNPPNTTNMTKWRGRIKYSSCENSEESFRSQTSTSTRGNSPNDFSIFPLQSLNIKYQTCERTAILKLLTPQNDHSVEPSRVVLMENLANFSLSLQSPVSLNSSHSASLTNKSFTLGTSLATTSDHIQNPKNPDLSSPTANLVTN